MSNEVEDTLAEGPSQIADQPMPSGSKAGTSAQRPRVASASKKSQAAKTDQTAQPAQHAQPAQPAPPAPVAKVRQSAKLVLHASQKSQQPAHTSPHTAVTPMTVQHPLQEMQAVQEHAAPVLLSVQPYTATKPPQISKAAQPAPVSLQLASATKPPQISKATQSALVSLQHTSATQPPQISKATPPAIGSLQPPSATVSPQISKAALVSLKPASATHPSRISQAGHTSPAAKQAVETVKQPAETVQQHAETVQQLSQTAKHPAEAVQQPAEAAVSSLTAGTSTRKDDAVKKTSVPSKLLASLTSSPSASVDLVRLNHKQAIKMARGPDKSPDIPLKMSADDYLQAQKQTPSLILGAADYLQMQKSKSFNSFEFEPRSISRTLTPPCSSSAPFGVPG